MLKQEFSQYLEQILIPTNHRITESLGLEKASQIIKSNRQPITTMPKPRPKVPRLNVFTFFEHLNKGLPYFSLT